ncbi:MAG: helix-turn-helix transcriptional regulator [Lachnospiraceae bacterium]|nr:helix-turn-helix transcriptional regulator [Lachnospiraceae bacterium]
MLNKKNVGKRIAYYRRDKGMTQKDLADCLNISYQSVSKWEAGSSLPTVDTLYEIASILNVSVDFLLNEDWWEQRWIRYQDTGLNTGKLYTLKNRIQELNSTDERLVSARYADAVLFKMDTTHMKEPIYSTITCIPGSKEKLAREHGYHNEICEDVAASGLNYILQYGLKPVILRGMVICGNFNYEKLLSNGTDTAAML